MKKIIVILSMVLIPLSAETQTIERVTATDIAAALKRAQAFRKNNDRTILDFKSNIETLDSRPLLRFAQAGTAVALAIPATFVGGYGAMAAVAGSGDLGFIGILFLGPTLTLGPSIMTGAIIHAVNEAENRKGQALAPTSSSINSLKDFRDLKLRLKQPESIYIFKSLNLEQREEYIREVLTTLNSLRSFQNSAARHLETSITEYLGEYDPSNLPYYERVLSLGFDQTRFGDAVQESTRARIALNQVFSTLSESLEAELLAANGLRSLK